MKEKKMRIGEREKEDIRARVDSKSTGSPSALCVGSGFRGHLVAFGRSILELLGCYLMPNKCKNLKDMKSSCFSVCTNSP